MMYVKHGLRCYSGPGTHKTTPVCGCARAPHSPVICLARQKGRENGIERAEGFCHAILGTHIVNQTRSIGSGSTQDCAELRGEVTDCITRIDKVL